MNTTKIKEKIEKLLRLATSPNENEAKSAMNKAVKLMQEHSIELSQLNGNQMITSIVETNYIIIPNWIISLYDGISSSVGVYCCYINGIRGSNRKGEFYLTGREVDVQNVSYIVVVLISQIMKMSKEYIKTVNGSYTNMERQTLSKSYRIGIVNGLINRMMKITDKFFKERQKGKDLLVVADNITKLNEAEDLFKKQYEVKSQSRKHKINTRAMIDGESDSSKIIINQGINGTKSTPTNQKLIA